MPHTKIREGQVVALTACPANRGANRAATLSGLYRLVEYEPADRTVGLYAGGWTVAAVSFDPAPHGTGLLICPKCECDTLSHEEMVEGYCQGCGEDFLFFVDDYDLWEQVDPQSFGDFLRWEREAEFWQEEADEAERSEA